MEKIEQQVVPDLFVNETNAHDNCVSIIQAASIQFIEISAIPELIESLQKYQSTNPARSGADKNERK